MLVLSFTLFYEQDMNAHNKNTYNPHYRMAEPNRMTELISNF